MKNNTTFLGQNWTTHDWTFSPVRRFCPPWKFSYESSVMRLSLLSICQSFSVITATCQGFWFCFWSFWKIVNLHTAETRKLQLSFVVFISCRHNGRDNYLFIYFVIRWSLGSSLPWDFGCMTKFSNCYKYFTQNNSSFFHHCTTSVSQSSCMFFDLANSSWFLLIRILFFQPTLKYSYFSTVLGWKYPCEYS